MGSVMVESTTLFEIASEVTAHIFTSPILESLREQRRQNVLCDISVECGDVQVIGHRCVLYAVSEYCRTFFTSSLSPTYRNGILVMELNSFSADTVQMLVDLIYGERSNDVSKVDIGELMQLTDYMQVPERIVTEILRKIISKENCEKLYEMSLNYNCGKLQRVLESFICHHLKELSESLSWQPSHYVLASLQKNPLYCSLPAELIGTYAKGISKSVDFGYTLISYNRC